MGLFLQTVLVLNGNENAVKATLEQVEKDSDIDLAASECQYQSLPKGTSVLLNENCTGYGELAQTLSDKLARPVLLLYIYDEDFWGYFFYENGRELDCFQTMPDYFEENSEEDNLHAGGNSRLIAEYFGVEEAEINKYFRVWTEELLDDYEAKAYEDDAFGQCDCWQMVDFMRKLGFPYGFPL